MNDVVLLTILQTSSRSLFGTTVNMEGTWDETTTGSALASVGLIGTDTSSLHDGNYPIYGDGTPRSFWFALETTGKLTFQASANGRGLAATYTPPGGGLETLAFRQTNGTSAYNTDVALFRTVDGLNQPPSMYDCRPLESLPLVDNNQLVAIATYVTSEPKSIGEGATGPVVQVLQDVSGAWLDRALLYFYSWPGFCPGSLAQSDGLIAGATTYVFSYENVAGDNYSGAVLSDVGGRWHLVTFAEPAGFAFSKTPVTTSGVISPDFGKQSVTSSDIWDAGRCSQSLMFRFDRPKDEFVSVGSTVDQPPALRGCPT
jgi:hypothetical protein